MRAHLSSPVRSDCRSRCRCRCPTLCCRTQYRRHETAEGAGGGGQQRGPAEWAEGAAASLSPCYASRLSPPLKACSAPSPAENNKQTSVSTISAPRLRFDAPERCSKCHGKLPTGRIMPPRLAFGGRQQRAQLAPWLETSGSETRTCGLGGWLVQRTHSVQWPVLRSGRTRGAQWLRRRR